MVKINWNLREIKMKYRFKPEVREKQGISRFFLEAFDFFSSFHESSPSFL